LSSQQVEALVEQYKGVIEANGGSVGRVENWGLKSLTYRINKNRKAHYTLMDITAPAAAIQEVERQQGLSEDILRFMTVRVEKHEEGASATAIAATVVVIAAATVAIAARAARANRLKEQQNNGRHQPDPDPASLPPPPQDLPVLRRQRTADRL
jgi:ribosomal protein S6